MGFPKVINLKVDNILPKVTTVSDNVKQQGKVWSRRQVEEL
jgi:hypothetical protein